MTAAPPPPLATLPGVHALHLAQLVERWSVSATELFGPLGMDAGALAAPDARLGVDDAARLLDRARALTGEPALGYLLGLQMRVSAHGWLGFAALAASTLREALELAVRFAPTRTTALALRLVIDGDSASLLLEERASLGAARETIVIALLVGLWQIGNAVTGRALVGEADFAVPAPPWFAAFGVRTPGRVRFDQPVNQLVFSAAQLDLPLVMADPAATRLAREQCERELDELGKTRDLPERVRRLLVGDDDSGPPPAQEAVAEALGLSPRTLKRRLAEHGTTFSELLDAHRRERAVLLVRSGELSVKELVERLGYSDAANFSRAFRRWTGTTPAAFRRRLNDRGA